MTDDMITDTSEKDVLSDYLTSLSTFLKYGYKCHAIKVNDDCTTNGFRFILGNSIRRCTPNSSHAMETRITCIECKFPYYAIDKMKQSIICNNTTLNRDNISEKTWKRNKIIRINTPRGLGFASTWNGGMCNVMVQAVMTDKLWLIEFEKNSTL